MAAMTVAHSADQLVACWDALMVVKTAVRSAVC